MSSSNIDAALAKPTYDDFFTEQTQALSVSPTPLLFQFLSILGHDESMIEVARR